MSEKIGRNADCPCGSGKKYKHCCLAKPGKSGVLGNRLLLILIISILALGAVAAFVSIRSYDPSAGGTRVWSEEHQHWH